MKKRILISVIASTLILSACSNSGQNSSSNAGAVEALTSEVSKLKKENAALKAELDDLKNSPAKLLAEGKTFFQKKDLASLKKTTETLKSKAPESAEYTELVGLVAKLSASVKAAEEKAKQQELAKAKANKKRLAEATSKMRKEYDEVSEVSFFYDKTTVKYVNQNAFYIYFSKSDDGYIPYPHIRIQYTGDKWISINRYIIKTDKNTYRITFGDKAVVKDHQGSVFWEYYDNLLMPDEFAMIEDIISSSKTIVRHEGKRTYIDRVITANEKAALRHVLDAYEAVGGKMH
ncbi:hypothetical protein ACFSR7_06830 [Cohnella sp. GCM10020058]|uniref:hypothetical protein n=1 Tax=Cohnella sp. GCM10020058 TaxID=3317330 RepID=UPI00362D0D31